MSNQELMLCWGTVNATSATDLIDAAGANGFASISLSPRLYAATKAGGVSDGALRVALDRAGVRIAVIEPLLRGLPGGLTEQTAPAELTDLYTFSAQYCLDMADALGAERVSVSHFLGRTVPIAQMIDAIGGMAQRARARGVELCIEFIPDTGIADLATAAAIHRAVGADHFGIMLDAWHFARSGGVLADLDALDDGAITVLQLCDRLEPEPGTAYVPMAGRLLPGDGELPLVALTQRVLRSNPNVVIGVEVFSADLQAQPARDAARLAATATRDVLAKVDTNAHR